MFSPLNLAILIPICPFVAFILIAALGRRLPGKGALVALPAMAVSWVLMLAVAFAWLSRGPALRQPGVVWETSYTWLNLGLAPLQIGYMVDSATVVLLFVVTTVGSLIFWFAMGYMEEDPEYPRFFAYLSLFAAAMLGVVISNSLLLFFICWEIMGLCSYFLIGFWYTKPSAMRAAKKAFVVTRVGDVGFFIGILALYMITHTLTFSEMFTEHNLLRLANTHWLVLGASCSALSGCALLVFCGSVGKSAQFPLHVWLPDAMEGPTPVSALIHAATMVAAGVFLVARVYPLFTFPAEYFGHIGLAMKIVAGIGAFTAVFAATMGLPNNDIKKVLAYSTISQLGYMFMGLGCFGYVAALFHLMTHAFFKALLFLGSGSVHHAVHTYDMRQMGGLRKVMPKTRITFLIGSLALAGVFPLAGFWSKDAILGFAYRNSDPYYAVVLLFGLFGAVLTAFYTARMYIMVFEGEPRDQQIFEHAHESPGIMTTPLIILAVGAVCIGLVGIPFGGLDLFSRFFGMEVPENLIRAEALLPTLLLMLFSTLLVAGAFFAAYQIYAVGKWRSPERGGLVRYGLQGWYGAASHLYCVDDFYNDTLAQPALSGSFLAASFDGWFVDGMLVNGTAALAVWLSRVNDWVDRNLVDGAVRVVTSLYGALGEGFRRVQQGVIQVYALIVFASVFALVLIARYLR